MKETHVYTAAIEPLRGLTYTEQITSIHARRPTIGPDADYGQYGDNIYFYQHHFSKVMGEEQLLDVLDAKGRPLVIDLMGPSSTLRDMFYRSENGQGRRGIAVTLEDRRSYKQRSHDKQLRIRQLSLDLTTEEGYRSLIKTMDGDKADLVMERALLGLAHIPIHPEYYRIGLERIWGMLSSQDGMFVGQTLPRQVMEQHGIPVQAWMHHMERRGIDARFADGDASTPYGALRIVRHPESPTRLHLPPPFAA